MSSFVSMLRILAAILLFSASASAAAPEKLELRGKVRYGAVRFRILRVALFRVEAPYTASTLTDPGGEFKFRDLAVGTYTVSVARRGLGEVRRSVVVTPALADKKGVVRIDIPFSAAEAVTTSSGGTVSRTRLTVPDKAVAKYLEAERRLNKHDVKGAEALLDEALKIAPQYTAAWNFHGVIAYQSRDLKRSEEYFRKGLEVEPDSFEPTVNLGGVMLGLGRPREALELNRKAVELRPKDALANAQLGMTYFELRDYDEAELYLETAKRADPAHFSQPQLYLAEIHIRRGNHNDAVRELKDLLARRPDGPGAERVRQTLAKLQAEP
jgi:tetratricopeptide (TPR) repeat protein